MPSPTGRELAAIGTAIQAEIKASRIEDYLHIRGDRMPAREAAARLGVTTRTITRYRRELRGGQPACPSTGNPGAAPPVTPRPASTPAPSAPTPTATAATPTGPAAAAAAAYQQAPARRYL